MLDKGRKRGDEPGFLEYTECLLPFDEENKALKCMCLQCATSGTVHEGHDVKADGEDRYAVFGGERLGAIALESTVSTATMFKQMLPYIRLRRSFRRVVTAFTLMNFPGSVRRKNRIHE